mmetsp:Transcript_23247/g.32473  ORF Transcript_23247/g.32473 Transcript_23247/m.32473 type:complete len:239 (-) Transcript_23247:123-839(-)
MVKFTTLILALAASTANVNAFQAQVPKTTFRTKTSLNSSPKDESNAITRRGLLGTAGGLLWLGGVKASFAAEETLAKYEDKDCGFQINLPTGWEKSEQSLPDRRKIVLYIEPDSDKKTLAFIAYTPIRDDFTSLSSFGSVENVGQATILPKSTLAGEENESKMLSAVSEKGSYYFDYVATAAGQPKTHFRTIFTLVQGATGGAGAVLATFTVQTPESKYDEYKPMFDEIISSYGKLKA